MLVDHINMDTLDNRRCNLRLATPAQNARNRRPYSRCGLKGVCFVPRKNKWQAQIWVSGREYFLGYHESKVGAALAYDRAALAAFGKYAWLNFPKRIAACAVARAIETTGGRIFSVSFVRRSDGVERTLLGRLGVTALLRGGEPAYEPADHGLITVFDMQNRDYRSVPIEGIRALSLDGERMRVA
jgi:hypothetical protein